jgi:hypothetical protein
MRDQLDAAVIQRVQRSNGLRGLLIAEGEPSHARWAIPGKPDEFLEGLRSEASVVVVVVVSSAAVLWALMHAGLPHDRFAFGGADWARSFVLLAGPQELVHFLARVNFICACSGSLPSSWLVGGFSVRRRIRLAELSVR